MLSAKCLIIPFVHLPFFLRILEYYLLFGKYFQISSSVRYYHKNFLPITMVDLAIFPVLWRLFFAVEFYFRPGLISLAHSCSCNVLVNQFCAVNWKIPGWHSCEISITIWVIIKNPGHYNQECPGVSWSRDCGSLSLSALSGPITPPPLPGIPPIVTKWAHIEGRVCTDLEKCLNFSGVLKKCLIFNFALKMVIFPGKVLENDKFILEK